MWWKKIAGYVLALVSGAVGTFVGGKLGPIAGASAGAAVAGAGAHILHLQPPPAKPPTLQGP